MEPTQFQAKWGKCGKEGDSMGAEIEIPHIQSVRRLLRSSEVQGKRSPGGVMLASQAAPLPATIAVNEAVLRNRWRNHGGPVSFFRCTLVSLHFVNMFFPRELRQMSWQRAMQCNETNDETSSPIALATMWRQASNLPRPLGGWKLTATGRAAAPDACPPSHPASQS